MPGKAAPRSAPASHIHERQSAGPPRGFWRWTAATLASAKQATTRLATSRVAPAGIAARLGLLLAIAMFPGLAPAQITAPPPDLLQRVAAHGSLFEKELGHYTYRQTFQFFELDKKGTPRGHYNETRDILFTPAGERTEEFVRGPVNALKYMSLTDEDFRDIRDVQPFLLNDDNLWNYDTTYKGIESIDGEVCYVYRVKPRQVLDGQRLLDGMMWVSREHQQVVRVAGQPVPQIYRESGDNLFPHFTTIYRAVDGKFWFPVKTVADDTLGFRSGLQRVRYTIDFESYKRFTAESSVQFESAEPEGEPQP
jgi:hypothetical protein